MRGEHTGESTDAGFIRGSSPHARGARHRSPRVSSLTGIIPACAGSTPTPPKSASCARDHPRMRGEHALALGNGKLGEGSSPHARGARLVRGPQAVHGGIIPACAGSTMFKCPLNVSLWDHPRMRGEHLNVDFSYRAVAGSSPHARGALRRWSQGSGYWGIIPACAGSTGLSARSRRRPRDHPRMRGEH